MKYGYIPKGSYNVGKSSNTGGIDRFYLNPNQDIGNRSNLQIHPKSTNPIWNFLGIDSKGCISTDGF